jgi:hypothetical protein
MSPDTRVTARPTIIIITIIIITKNNIGFQEREKA